SGHLEVCFEGEPPPLGAWVIAHGKWTGSILEATEIDVVSTPTRPFPARDGEWLRLHGQGRVLERLQARAAARTAVRRFFDQRAFLEVETPLAVPSPGLDLHLAAVEAIGLGDRRWLVTSPEYQMKRLLAGGLNRIYQLARCFRRGEQGAQHEPELTMVEWYRAFAGSEEIMRDTEELVAAVARALFDGSTRIPGRGRTVDVAPPWKRITVEDAFRHIAGVPLEAVLPDE